MADSEDPARRDSVPAGPRTQPCRPVPRVHAFGKGGQALRRDPHTPPAMRGWLHKQDSSGLRLWKRRWFVLVDLCLYYYRDSSEQQVRGGLPLPGYEIHILPPAPRAPRAPQFLFTAEHPGMRTYCLGAETPEELHAWVSALRCGASPLPRSPQQMPQEPRSTGPPSPPLPRHSPGEGLGNPPELPPRCPPVPPLSPSEVPAAQDEPPAREGPPRTGDTQGGPRGAPEPAPTGRSPKTPRPPGAAPEPPPERNIGTNRPRASPTASSDWLPSSAGPPGSAPAPTSNEASWSRRAGAGGRGWAREGVAGRPIRITLLQASF